MLKQLKTIWARLDAESHCEFCNSTKEVGSWTGEYISMCKDCYLTFKVQDKQDKKKKKRKRILNEILN